MKRNYQEIEPVEVLAMLIYAGALSERCRAMITRLSTPETLAAEVAEFRQQALRDVEGAVTEGFAIDDEADALRRARHHVETICAAWLGREPPAQD